MSAQMVRGFPPHPGGETPLDSLPVVVQWTAGESNPDYLGANQVSFRWTSSPCFSRSVRKSNLAIICQCAGQELNLHIPKAAALQAVGLAHAQPTHVFQ